LYQEGDWQLSEAASSFAKVDELEQAAGAIRTVEGGTLPADGMPGKAIRFEGVSFTYPGRPEPVFKGLDIEIEAAPQLAIGGENGAGKTTLAKLLPRLHDPTEGRISVDGVDLRDLSAESWHRRVAAVFQDFARFEFPAYDNVALGALHAWNN